MKLEHVIAAILGGFVLWFIERLADAWLRRSRRRLTVERRAPTPQMFLRAYRFAIEIDGRRYAVSSIRMVADDYLRVEFGAPVSNGPTVGDRLLAWNGFLEKRIKVIVYRRDGKESRSYEVTYRGYRPRHLPGFDAEADRALMEYVDLSAPRVTCAVWTSASSDLREEHERIQAIKKAIEAENAAASLEPPPAEPPPES